MPVGESAKGQHVAILAFPFGCHAAPLLNLVHRLAGAIPDVQFSFFNTPKSNDSLFSVSKTDPPNNFKAYSVADGVPGNRVFTENLLDVVELFIEEMPENFIRCIDAAVAETGRRITCLISDTFLTSAADMAKDMHVPWIPVWISTPYNLSAHFYTDLIRQYCANTGRNSNGSGGTGGAIPRDRTLEFIPGLSVIRIADIPSEILPGDSKERLFSCMLSKVGRVLPQAAAVVMNFYQELWPTPVANDLESKLTNILNVGFLTLSLPPLPPLPLDSDASGCLSWLDGQKSMSVAYISFGTVATLPHNEFVALMEALEVSGTPYLWSHKDNSKEHLADGFIERTSTQGKMVSWAPQTRVLAHSSIGVFVTHCGCNSVYESIANGVPMICRPFFGDHPMNGRIVEEVWGIGARVEGGVLTKNGVLKSLELIMAHEQGKKVREKGQGLKELVLKADGADGSAARDFNALVKVISGS